MQKIIAKIRSDLSIQVLIGFTLGILAGLFFGEMVSPIRMIGDAYLRLFQMPVIPYIVVSLIAGLGSLSIQEAKSLFLNAGKVLVMLWLIIIVILILGPLGFPSWQSASFFSSSLLEPEKAFDFLELFFPNNPFFSLANTIVPAVVTFSIGMGLAFITLKNKQTALDLMSSLADALMRITGFIAKLTPIGVFAITANAAGTLNLNDVGRLQVYIVVQTAIALLLSFWILPGLVTVFTPLKRSEIIEYTSAPLLTAFATANLLVVLPILVESSKKLIEKIEASIAESHEDKECFVDVIVAASFNFPNLGKLLSLGFIPFAAWYGGSSLPLSQYPNFLITGIASFFGDGILAMQFLLNLLQIPSDMLQLYITVDIFASRFGTLLAAMHTVVLALLGTLAMQGLMTARRRRLIRFGIGSILVTLLILGSIHLFYTHVIKNAYTKDQVLGNLELLKVRDPQEVQVFKEPLPPLPPLSEEQESRFDQILQRGQLRACYQPNSYPMSYFNQSDNLVGFDIEIAHILAKELDVGLELVPLNQTVYSFEQIAQKLNRGYCNLFISQIAINPKNKTKMAISVPISDLTLAFLVKDYQRNQFNSWAEMQKQYPDLKLGIINLDNYYKTKLRGLLPQVKLLEKNEVEFREFLESKGEKGDIDALLISAEHGAIWTIFYPDFGIAIPKPMIRIPVAYVMPLGDQKLANVVNTWLQLKQKDGTINSLFKYWVEGKIEEVQPPRWSIIRDVLHWIH